MSLPPPARSLLSRVLVVLALPSAGVLACDDDAAAPKPTGFGGAGAAGAPSEGLQPIPPATPGKDPGFGYPVCGNTPAPYPDGTPADTGPCCVRITCREPTTSGACPDPADVHLGKGSGTCDCGETDGPYAATEAQTGDRANGRSCCYRARVMPCTGRPLCVSGRSRVAPLRLVGDWASV